MNNSTVYPKLPRAGLGNMLLVWSKAVVFAQLNSLPLIAPHWGKIALGPYLRRERYVRYYGDFFNNNCATVSGLRAAWFKIASHKIYEPSISKLEPSASDRQAMYVFEEIPHWRDYFGDIRDYYSLVKSALTADIKPAILQEIERRATPEIAIHVRMSDFRKLQPGEDFTKVGLVRTPMDWYLEVLQKIRKIAGYNVPVTVFSDGHDEELKSLLSLPQVTRSPNASALSDMLTLAKSKLLVTSAGSTFSGWASYLGRCPTIWHPAHFHGGVFTPEVSRTIFEGGFDPQAEVPDLLKNNVVSLFREKVRL